jgi:hypothetical protein
MRLSNSVKLFLVTVVQESRSCVVTVTSDQQYVSSSSFIADADSASGCGSRSHPWRLQAPPGQRINISLLDFSGSVSLPQDRDVACRQYGYIVDKSNKKNVSLCGVNSPDGDKLQREIEVFTSFSNSLEIVLVTGRSENYNFLVRLNGTFIA